MRLKITAKMTTGETQGFPRAWGDVNALRRENVWFRFRPLGGNKYLIGSVGYYKHMSSVHARVFYGHGGDGKTHIEICPTSPIYYNRDDNLTKNGDWREIGDLARLMEIWPFGGRWFNDRTVVLPELERGPIYYQDGLTPSHSAFRGARVVKIDEEDGSVTAIRPLSKHDVLSLPQKAGSFSKFVSNFQGNKQFNARASAKREAYGNAARWGGNKTEIARSIFSEIEATGGQFLVLHSVSDESKPATDVTRFQESQWIVQANANAMNKTRCALDPDRSKKRKNSSTDNSNEATDPPASRKRRKKTSSDSTRDNNSPKTTTGAIANTNRSTTSSSTKTSNPGKRKRGGVRKKSTQSEKPAKSIQGDGSQQVQTSVATGLHNIGNTCYLNSVLQALFAIPGFVADLKATRDDITASHRNVHREVSAPKLPFANVLIQLAQRMSIIPTDDEGSHPNLIVADPRDLKQVIDADCSKRSVAFPTGRQQDADEFIIYLMDTLHDELKKASIMAGVNIDLPTDTYFLLEVEEERKCFQCGHSNG